MELKELIAVRPAKKVYKDGDLAIKVFEEGFSKADILNEALNHARVEETGLPIPRIHEVTKIGNQWAIVMDFIKGKTLTQLMKENPEKFEEYMNRFVDIQLLIHSKRLLCSISTGTRCTERFQNPDLMQLQGMNCIPGLKACQSIQKYVTVISTPAI